MAESIKIYNILRGKQEVFSDEEAQMIASALGKEDNGVTREDLARIELRTGKALSKIRMTDVVLWLATMSAIVLTNARILYVITRLLDPAR